MNGLNAMMFAPCIIPLWLLKQLLIARPIFKKKELVIPEIKEGKNLIELYSYKNNDVKQHRNKIKINFKYTGEFTWKNHTISDDNVKMIFHYRYWKHTGATEAEIEKIYYFLFAFNYDEKPLLMQNSELISKIQNDYHEIQNNINT
ncbi:hypothetical protein [Mycoplasma seminis]|uniref:Uncharacterized protein n=1 Tax=Mycoplasma seminis TaxID=512749 RepID=A0ABY9H9C0_9MOLU|nr:hypothetical protein [Mycoplasma seminis]WLP85175.1 hypothetical protein Q8852_02520 [Mycoplasma seminis]